jgi:hypothetical protein
MSSESSQHGRLRSAVPVDWTDDVAARVDQEREWLAYKRAGQIMSYAVIEAAFDVVFKRREEAWPQQVREFLEGQANARVPFNDAWAAAMAALPFPAGWSRKKAGARSYTNLERPTSPLEFMEDCMRKAYNERLERTQDAV